MVKWDSRLGEGERPGFAVHRKLPFYSHKSAKINRLERSLSFEIAQSKLTRSDFILLIDKYLCKPSGKVFDKYNECLNLMIEMIV